MDCLARERRTFTIEVKKNLRHKNARSWYLSVVAERVADWEKSAAIVADDEPSVKELEMARSTTRMR